MTSDSEKNIYSADYKRITIKTVDGDIIHGQINLAAKQRVSDIFTRSDQPFIIVVNAMSKETQGKTLFINKDRIIWVEPDE